MESIKETNKEVAITILQQLGGKRFLVFTGSHDLVCTENSLRMKLTRNRIGATHLTITLMPNDTYKMEFIKVVDGNIKNDYKTEIINLKTYADVYFDMLQDLFEKATGLYTHL